jgi:hypothetical protein
VSPLSKRCFIVVANPDLVKGFHRPYIYDAATPGPPGPYESTEVRFGSTKPGMPIKAREPQKIGEERLCFTPPQFWLVPMCPTIALGQTLWFNFFSAVAYPLPAEIFGSLFSWL